MTNIEKIRAYIERTKSLYRDGESGEALAALVELERAATEPVAWIVGQQTMGGDVAEVLRWNRGTPPHSVGVAPRPLYTAPPPAQPAPGMFTAEEVREAYREGYSDWQHGRRILEADWRISMTFKLIKDRA